MSRVVVITGASAGVGRATARRFAREGAHIALLARGSAGLEATREDVEDLGGKAIIIPTDVANAEEVEEAARLTEQELGPIDVWINNAMVTVFSPFVEMTAEEYHRVTEVTYLGTVYGTMSALRRMKPRDQGVVLQVGSALAYRSIPLQSAYCGSKHAIQGFSESIRSELMHDKSAVRISMVQMPALNTPQFEWCRNKLGQASQPVPPIYEPEVAAEGIYWAVEHTPRESAVGSLTGLIIDLNKFFPGIGDRYLAETGYESQMTGETLPEDRPDNLFEPVNRDLGARGSFSDLAKDHTAKSWASEHKPLIATAVGGLAAAAIFMGNRRGSEGRDALPDTRTAQPHRIP